MLLSFKTKNYKSFTEETLFSMAAAPKQSGLDYSLFRVKIKSKEVRGLCSSVIYGPNATGKTNLIGAMDVLRSIILKGNIKNSEENSIPNPAASSLELIPNNQIESQKPVEFGIDFVENGLKIRYDISIDLGKFLDKDYSRKILNESLYINEELIFNRTEHLLIDNLKSIKHYLSSNVIEKTEALLEIAQNSLNPEELFLTNGFKLIFSQSLVKLITNWFTDKFMVICHADSMQLIKRFADPQKKTVYIETTTDKAAKLFGVNSNAIGYISTGEDEADSKLCSIIDDNTAIASEIFESYGTIRFINIFPLVIRAIQTGGTLVVDEFDASIHPMALMSIINVFHNDDININHAQLIFNTHNPIFLNSNLFRRDEIKFVERDDTTNKSIVYSLSDFGTSGSKGVRKHEDYMKNYFVSQYGAIKDIDFTPLFEEILNIESEVESNEKNN